MGCTPSRTKVIVQPRVEQHQETPPSCHHKHVIKSEDKDVPSSKRSSASDVTFDHEYELIPGSVNADGAITSRDIEPLAPVYGLSGYVEGGNVTTVPSAGSVNRSQPRLLSGVSSHAKYCAQDPRNCESAKTADHRQYENDENENSCGLGSLPMLSTDNKLSLWREKSISTFWYNIGTTKTAKETSPLSGDSQYYSQEPGERRDSIQSWTDISEDGSASVNSLSSDDTLPAAYKEYRDRAAILLSRPKAAVGRRSDNTHNRPFHVETLHS